MMRAPWCYLLWLGILAVSHCHKGVEYYHEQFDRIVKKFLEDNKYNGGALAALKDGQIIYAKGYGVNKKGHSIKDTSLFPVASISKSMTAVAILQLSEIGAVDLDGKVFGPGGYLHMIKPKNKKTVDPRLHDITVKHLLHHSGGWDANKGPLYDPILNAYYVKKGLNVTNIAKLMGALEPLLYYDIIQYVMSQTLDFTPGTRTIPSHFGYTLLGRIIEEVADTSYEDFVKQNVLKPCGMWHTRLGSKEKIAQIDKLSGPWLGDSDFTLYDVIHPVAIDSTLGWYSNVFDMMRFIRCIKDHPSTGLLKRSSVNLFTTRPQAAPVQHSTNWYGVGFRANIEGSIWQDGDRHANDVLLFYSHKHTHPAHTPDAWVFLLEGESIKHLKHKCHSLIEFLGPEFVQDEMILHDLSDVQLPSTVLKFRVDEHHLHAYINALKQESYDVTWINGFDAQRHTMFTVIAEKTDAPHDYLVEHGFTQKQLQSRKLELEDEGYNMTMLQNYKSYSHDMMHSFLAVFRKSAYDKHTHMKWGIHHYPRPYDKLLGLYTEKGYYPVVQSYIHVEEEALISFILLKRDKQRKVNFKEYHDLSIPQLEKAVRSNANGGRRLAYFDASVLYKKPRFSAVFTDKDPTLWMFVAELEAHNAGNFIQENIEKGYHPTKVVGYARTEKTIKYAVLIEKTKA